MEEEFIKIPKWSLKLLKTEGYFERYHFHCKQLSTKGQLTYKEAYLRTEKELNQYFKLNKYENYENFRSAKSYYQSKKTDANGVLLSFI